MILREIKREFAGSSNSDRFMEECIKAGYLRRENKALLSAGSAFWRILKIIFRSGSFCSDGSPIHQELRILSFETSFNQITYILLKD